MNWRYTLAVGLMLLGMCAAQVAPAGVPAPAGGTLTPAQLQDLVAPIALYPDQMLAQVLAASTFPDQITTADQWIHQNSGLSGPALAKNVDQQNWDPSVKGLTEYPAVLDNLNQNLSWTSSLGDAYYNQPDQIMTAVQQLRQRAWAAGTLRSTSQQTVTVQSDGTIIISPGNPNEVYVPEYDAWTIYGAPLEPWPGYEFGFGIGGPGLFFSVGYPLGWFSGFGWGWGGWGADWGGGYFLYNRGVYRPHSPVFFNHAEARGMPRASMRGAPIRAGMGRAVANSPSAARALAETRAAPNARTSRGYAAPGRSSAGVRSGAFSGFDRGGASAGNAARGRASMGGGARGGGGRH